VHPSITDDTLGRIGHLADQAAADTDRWPAVVDAMARAFNANGAVLFTPPPDATRSPAATAGNTRDCLGDYAEVGARGPVDPAHGARPLRRRRRGRTGPALAPVEDLRATRFFGDFVRHHDLEGMMSLKVCDHRDALAPVTHLTLFRVAPIADSAACASAWPLAHCLLTLVLPEAEHPAAVQSWLNALGRHHGLTGAEVRVRVLGLLARTPRPWPLRSA
jgi:hypothetical protein